jgi:hypothetical protein
MLLVGGSVEAALAAAEAFYADNGFTRDGNGQLHSNDQLRNNSQQRDGRYRIVMVAMNRDHSATETNLTIALSHTG